MGCRLDTGWTTGVEAGIGNGPACHQETRLPVTRKHIHTGGICHWRQGCLGMCGIVGAMPTSGSSGSPQTFREVSLSP